MTRTEALLLVDSLSIHDQRVQNAIRLAQRCRQSRPQASACSCVACAIDAAVRQLTDSEHHGCVGQREA